MTGLLHHSHLMVILLVVSLSNPAFVPDQVPASADAQLSCPERCRCLAEEKTASCLVPYSEFSLETLSQWKIKSLELYQDEQNRVAFPSFKSALYEDSKMAVTNIGNGMLGLPHLVHLDISNIAILQLRDFAFVNMPHLQVLKLMYDNIASVQPYTFAGLSSLTNLSLRNNSISSLPKHVFGDLLQLNFLDLGENNLKMIEADTFDRLSNLKTLDLSRNALTYISDFTGNLTSLEELDLSDNIITYILNDTVSNLLKVKTVKIKGNKFECSCAISVLIHSTQQNMSFVNPGDIVCSGPNSLVGKSFKDLVIDNLPCEGARVDSVTDNLSVRPQESVTLNCTATGTAPLGIYWVTPRGDNFSHAVMHSVLPELITNVKYDSHYAGVNLPLETRVFMSENGSLHIEKFRGYFSGNFTCVAVNLISRDEFSVEITVYTNFFSIYYTSLYISAICAVVAFIIAATIGGIRWCVSKCFHDDECNCCCCSNDDEFVDPRDIYKVKSQEIEVKNGEIYYKPNSDSDEDKDFYEDSPPKTPFNSPAYQTPEESPGKCHTPDNESIEAEGWISSRILDQLDEVRSRLRDGAERKMMKVKSFGKSIHESSSNTIKNIKESGSLKIQSIRETGSQAASAVMKGVESGMEQVKYGYQSIREFCGTSDMGPGTISMVSVTTDVDTKEQTRVVKSHTFV